MGHHDPVFSSVILGPVHIDDGPGDTGGYERCYMILYGKGLLYFLFSVARHPPMGAYVGRSTRLMSLACSIT